MRGLNLKHRLAWAFALVLLFIGSSARTEDNRTGLAGLIEVKVGINTLTKEERATLWRRVEEYATVDALQEFCGRKLNLQRRTWAAVAPCVEVTSLRRVASVFRSKKAEFLKGWEQSHGEAEKKKELCGSLKSKLVDYSRIIDAHITEARQMCDVCIFC